MEASDTPVALTLGKDQTLPQKYERTANKSSKKFQIFRTKGGNQNHFAEHLPLFASESLIFPCKNLKMTIYECSFISAFIRSEPLSFTLQEEHTECVHI